MRDWIIFRIKDENKEVVNNENVKTKSKHYWLKQIKIKNADYSNVASGVKQMRIEVSADKNEWKVCDQIQSMLRKMYGYNHLMYQSNLCQI